MRRWRLVAMLAGGLAVAACGSGKQQAAGDHNMAMMSAGDMADMNHAAASSDANSLDSDAAARLGEEEPAAGNGE